MGKERQPGGEGRDGTGMRDVANLDSSSGPIDTSDGTTEKRVESAINRPDDEDGGPAHFRAHPHRVACDRRGAVTQLACRAVSPENQFSGETLS